MANYVTVACKLPHGIWLRTFQPHEEDAVKRDGSTERVTIYREAARFRIRGNAIPVTRDPEKDYPQVLGGPNGYALTHSVPAELWASWLEANKDSSIVTNKLIFAAERSDTVRAEAKECASIKTGLERLSRDGDERMPRRIATSRAA